ncbi:sugar phosphate isomerase/epimerase [Actinocorallia sp. API 0066]|uniref:sugar phosphate isomerase/epimerase family protein n=1 Tax=Actinocorallia sp. API 0066 TaxID=2896846 RepID=UPI001E55B641|nr:sugar phosphate isomerase/epimerase [Actinocorallia sp. API 0066]MCD0451473.1 sugar phosphate isomerase/epimerase [Actinocorallia sp. API 0066]
MSAFTPCLNPATLSGLALPDFLEAAASAGFTSVEVPVQQVVAHGPGRVADLLAGLGLSVAAASGLLPAGPVLPHPVLVEDYADALTGLPERLEAMRTIGCPVATIVVNPRSLLARDAALSTAAARLRALARVAGEYGVTVAAEAVGVQRGLPAELDGPHPVVTTLPELAGLLERTPGVVACVDSFHWAATGADPVAVAGLTIGHVQIADTPPGPRHLWSDGQRLFPGDGGLPWIEFAGALAVAGYRGPLSVELFNPALRALSEDEICRRALHGTRTCWKETS